MPDQRIQQLITIDQLADMCQVSRRTVEKWNRTKTGPQPIRIGKYTRYRPSAVDAWLKKKAA